MGVGFLVVISGAAGAAQPPDGGLETVALPGGPPVVRDYLAVDAVQGQLWAPAGNSERIDVVDVKTGALRSIEHQPIAKRGERTVGPSSATVGDGVVYVGNRADSSICGFDARTLEPRGCTKLTASPDGLAWVSTTREVWATTPKDDSLVFLAADAAGALTVKGSLKLAGGPEGYAVDAARGLFYTNLEDGDRTLAIDVRTKKVVSTWKPECGKEGPRGLAIDTARRQLFVACTDRLKVLDASGSGKVLGELLTGAGVDNIDLVPSSHRAYVASGKESRLTIAEASAAGALSAVGTFTTSPGCRTVVVVPASGVAWLPDSKEGRLVVVRPEQAAVMAPTGSPAPIPTPVPAPKK
jgi:DNA-binding beta-propeller fold protein YncE